MTHTLVPILCKMIAGTFVRVSVGIGDKEDLIKEFKQSLDG